MTETVPEAVARLRALRAARAVVEADRPRVPGRLWPCERIDALVDAGSFLELGALTSSQLSGAADRTPGDGLLAGWATIAGQEVGVLIDDPVVLAATDGQVARNKRLRVLNTCAIRGNPVVYVVDGLDDDPQLGAPARGALFGFMGRQWPEPPPSAMAKPSVAVVLGPCRGRAAELTASADVVIVGPDARLDPAMSTSRADDDASALAAARLRFEATPAEVDDPPPPVREPAVPLTDEGDAGATTLIDGLCDAGSATIVHESPGLVCADAALGGHEVVLVITEHGAVLGAGHLGAVADAAARCRLTARSLILVQDTAGYDLGATSSASFLRALSDAVDAIRSLTSPKISVVVGAGHVNGTFAMGGRQIGIDHVVALPAARVAAVDVPWYQPGAVPDEWRDGPWLAAGLGHIDEVVAADELRDHLARMLGLFAHGAGLPTPEQDRAGRYIDDIPKV